VHGGAKGENSHAACSGVSSRNRQHCRELIVFLRTCRANVGTLAFATAGTDPEGGQTLSASFDIAATNCASTLDLTLRFDSLSSRKEDRGFCATRALTFPGMSGLSAIRPGGKTRGLTC
jgi:hypothetical protein